MHFVFELILAAGGILFLCLIAGGGILTAKRWNSTTSKVVRTAKDRVEVARADTQVAMAESETEIVRWKKDRIIDSRLNREERLPELEMTSLTDKQKPVSKPKQPKSTQLREPGVVMGHRVVEQRDCWSGTPTCSGCGVHIGHWHLAGCNRLAH